MSILIRVPDSDCETTSNFLQTGVRAIKVANRRTLSMPAIADLVSRYYPGTNLRNVEIHFQQNDAGKEEFYIVLVP